MTAQTLTVAQCYAVSRRCQGRGSQGMALTDSREDSMTADDTQDMAQACVPISTLTNCLRAVRNERYQTVFDLESGDYEGYEAEVQGWIDTLEDVESEVEDALLKGAEQSDWTAEQIDKFIQDYNL